MFGVVEVGEDMFNSSVMALGWVSTVLGEFGSAERNIRASCDEGVD
jgi:hypothetical protein